MNVIHPRQAQPEMRIDFVGKRETGYISQAVSEYLAILAGLFNDKQTLGDFPDRKFSLEKAN
jgi:hypothetical protein